MYDGWAVSKRDRCPKATLICQLDILEISSVGRALLCRGKGKGSESLISKYILEIAKVVATGIVKVHLFF